MKKIFLAALLTLGVFTGTAQATLPGGTALILYDYHGGDNYGRLAKATAILLSNLMGHFNMNGDIQPIENYVAGEMAPYAATFYLGTYYDNPVPAAFLTDVQASTKPVVWFRYNIWQFAWNSTYNFTATYGFSFTDLRSFDGALPTDGSRPGFFDTVSYKGMNMVKYYAYDGSSGTAAADPDAGITAIVDSTKAQTIATITDPKTNEIAPYVIRSGNFWYVADDPFSFIGPQDRYLVLCDVLHDMLGVNHPTLHRALVRLEDVSANVDMTSMQTLSDYLNSKAIPFSIATITHYKDPLGHYNGGVAQDIPFAQATTLQNALKYALTKGAKLVMHSFTHQYDSQPNKNTGVSADDFEFWNAVTNAPVTEDSSTWAGGRVDSGLAELSAAGFTRPFAFEPAHYQASPVSYRAIQTRYSQSYQRAVYYSSEVPNLDPTLAVHDYSAGQFYPYITEADYYGSRVIPENLGNIEYNICNIDPYSCMSYTWQTMLTNAQYGLVVRDGFASFFFHPFWIESSLSYLNAYSDFQSLVTGITNLGYTWVDASAAQNVPGAPAVVITAPLAGATVSGTVSVTETITDDVPMSKVELYVDNVLNTTSTTSPYTFAWKSVNVLNGSHTLLVKAYNVAGFVGTSASVTVTVSNPLPVAKVTSPNNNATVTNNTTVNISVSGTDSASGVKKLETYVNGTLLCTKTLTTPPASTTNTCAWRVPRGAGITYTLTAKAYDVPGNVGTSTAVTVKSK